MRFTTDQFIAAAGHAFSFAEAADHARLAECYAAASALFADGATHDYEAVAVAAAASILGSPPNEAVGMIDGAELVGVDVTAGRQTITLTPNEVLAHPPLSAWMAPDLSLTLATLTEAGAIGATPASAAVQHALLELTISRGGAAGHLFGLVAYAFPTAPEGGALAKAFYGLPRAGRHLATHRLVPDVMLRLGAELGRADAGISNTCAPRFAAASSAGITIH